MANTITGGYPIVNITVNDSDWTGQRLPVQSIQFNPEASGDKLVVKDYDANGPVIFQTTADGASDETIKYLHGLTCTPFIDYSACSIGTTALAIIIYG